MLAKANLGGFYMTLAMAEIGQEFQIKKITGKDSTRRFLANLGFIEGASVSVVSKLGNNQIICVKDSRVAIDTSMANRILI